MKFIIFTQMMIFFTSMLKDYHNKNRNLTLRMWSRNSFLYPSFSVCLFNSNAFWDL